MKLSKTREKYNSKILIVNANEKYEISKRKHGICFKCEESKMRINRQFFLLINKCV